MYVKVYILHGFGFDDGVNDVLACCVVAGCESVARLFGQAKYTELGAATPLLPGEPVGEIPLPSEFKFPPSLCICNAM